MNDTYIRGKKYGTDKLFIDLNSYHENIKLTLETSPNKFLDTEIIRNDQGIKMQAYNKMEKLPVPWYSKVPFKYKRKAITGELHRAKRRASDFDEEKKLEVNTQTQDTQNMLLKTLSGILTERKMSL